MLSFLTRLLIHYHVLCQNMHHHHTPQCTQLQTFVDLIGALHVSIVQYHLFASDNST
jgi:hypothetical protein